MKTQKLVRLRCLFSASLIWWCQMPSIKALYGTPPWDIMAKTSTESANAGKLLPHQLFQGFSPLTPEPPSISLAFYFSCKLSSYRSFRPPRFFRNKRTPTHFQNCMYSNIITSRGGSYELQMLTLL